MDMEKVKWLVVAAVFVAGAAALATLTVGRAKADGAVTGKVDGEAEVLGSSKESVGERIDSLQRELATVRQLTALQLAAASQEDAKEDVSKNDSPESPAELDPDTYRQRQAAALSDAFGVQERDPNWSSQTESALRNVFDGGAVPGSKLEALSCASTMCKVSVTHVDEAAQRALALSLREGMPFMDGTYFVYADDGHVRTTTFFAARQGHDLPFIAPDGSPL